MRYRIGTVSRRSARSPRAAFPEPHATFFVNKERVDIAASVPGDTPLLWILRDSLNLTGTKYGCGMALCGACTVYIDGQPARSCQTPLSALKPGAEITTIEGLKTQEGKAVQAAWEKLDVPQCGYCQSGQVMSATALLAKKKRRPTPTSTPRWPATSAAAPPTSASARRSRKRRRALG